MMSSRRTALTVLGGIVLGLGTTSATGAFDRIELERDVEISVDGDEQAYLRLTVHESRTESTTGPIVTHIDGKLTLDFTPSEINPGGITEFDDLFVVHNLGSSDIELDIEFFTGDGTKSIGMTAYDSDDPAGQIGTLPSTQHLVVGVRVDASDPADIDAVDTMLIEAESS